MNDHNTKIMIAGLKALIQGQQQQNQLLSKLIDRLSQQNAQLDGWKQANPELSQDCKRACEILGKIQGEYLRELTDEVLRDGENLDEWALREFIDKYGQRLMQFNGMLAYLAQLGAS